MMNTKVRSSLFLFSVAIAAVLLALQLVLSVDSAVFLFVMASVVLVVFLEPFAGLVYFLALDYVMPQTFVPGLLNVRIMLIVGSAVLASMLIHAGFKERTVPITRAPQDYLLAWFFIAILVSNLSQLRIPEAMTSAVRFAVPLLFYLLCSSLIKNENRLRIVLHVLGALTVWIAIQGIVQHYTGMSLGGAIAKKGRIQGLGWFQNANAFANVLVVMVPLFCLQLANTKSVLPRIYSTMSIIVICYAVYLTGSRGAWLALGVLMAYLMFRRFGSIRAAILATSLLCTIYVFGPSRLREINPSESSAHIRLVNWDRGLQLFKSNPLFGVGYGNSSVPGVHMIAHNAFIQNAAELGIVGLLPWVLLIYISMKNLIFVIRHRAPGAPSAHGKIALYAETILLGLLVAVVSTSFTGTPYEHILYALIALSVAATRIFVEESEDAYRLFEKKDFVNGVLITAGALFCYRVFLFVVGF